MLRASVNKNLVMEHSTFLAPGSLPGMLNIRDWLGLVPFKDLPGFCWVQGRQGGPPILDCVFMWAGVTT